MWPVCPPRQVFHGLAPPWAAAFYREVVPDAVCEIKWGVRDGGLVAECGDCGTTHAVLEPQLLSGVSNMNWASMS